jgi:hypothetical protein
MEDPDDVVIDPDPDLVLMDPLELERDSGSD